MYQHCILLLREVLSAEISDLTSGRIVTAGTNGELQDSQGLTFDGTVLTRAELTTPEKM